jgi:hypothetical protein
LTWLIPARGVYNRPAMVHDFLYHYAPVDPTTGRYVHAGTRRCDSPRGVRELRRSVHAAMGDLSSAFVLGGWIQWRKYRRQEQAAADAPTHG